MEYRINHLAFLYQPNHIRLWTRIGFAECTICFVVQEVHHIERAALCRGCIDAVNVCIDARVAIKRDHRLKEIIVSLWPTIRRATLGDSYANFWDCALCKRVVSIPNRYYGIGYLCEACIVHVNDALAAKTRAALDIILCLSRLVPRDIRGLILGRAISLSIR
jgi:hypothetical protein